MTIRTVPKDDPFSPTTVSRLDPLFGSHPVAPASAASDLESQGFAAAASNMGVPAALETRLTIIYRSYQAEDEPRRERYLSDASELQEDNRLLELELKPLVAARTQENARTRDIRKELTDLEDEMARPDPADAHDFNPLAYWASAALLVGLTLYLIVFYTSAGYSAFFKNVGASLADGGQSGRIKALFNSIFDSGALPEAIRSANLFVLLFPVIFTSVGFVIHRLYERGQRLAAAAFLAVALVFDCLIAYQIAEKLFDAQFLTGLKTGEWTLARAAVDANFWSVIAAGFVVYLIWTFLLGFFVTEHERRAAWRRTLHGLRRRLTARRQEIRDDEARREARIAEIEQRIRENTLEIQKKKNLADGRVLRWSALEGRVESFVMGWLTFVVRSTESPAEQSAKAAEVRAIVDRFKASLEAQFTGHSETVTLTGLDRK